MIDDYSETASGFDQFDGCGLDTPIFGIKLPKEKFDSMEVAQGFDIDALIEHGHLPADGTDVHNDETKDEPLFLQRLLEVHTDAHWNPTSSWESAGLPPYFIYRLDKKLPEETVILMERWGLGFGRTKEEVKSKTGISISGGMNTTCYTTQIEGTLSFLIPGIGEIKGAQLSCALIKRTAKANPFRRFRLGVSSETNA